MAVLAALCLVVSFSLDYILISAGEVRVRGDVAERGRYGAAYASFSKVTVADLRESDSLETGVTEIKVIFPLHKLRGSLAASLRIVVITASYQKLKKS